jgi:TIR domain
MLVFLSYAEEDEQVAAEVVCSMRRNGADVYRWQDKRGGRIIKTIETAISAADQFVALMSPSFLASEYCGRESEFALNRETAMLASNPSVRFITVLEIRPTPKGEAGFLGSYDWPPAATPGERAETIRSMMDGAPPDSSGVTGVGPASATVAGAPEGPAAAWSPSFWNREDEIDEVKRGLTSKAGAHFWVVIAPPQLGKTWFVNRLAVQVRQNKPSWTVRNIDLKDVPAKERTDTPLLVENLFGIRQTDNDFSLQIAKEILRRGQSYVCILDSAELLDRAAVDSLRTYFKDVHHWIQQGVRQEIWLAVVVASRRDDGWQGLREGPRFSLLPLTEFKVEVVQYALLELAGQIQRGVERIRQFAEIVHDVSEGLPALLVQCLRWIQAEEWLRIERLRDDPDVFERLISPYVRDVIFAEESLFPQQSEREFPLERERGLDPGQVLTQCFRVLTPYRFFTQSHLRHYIAADANFSRVIEHTGWSAEKVWNYLSNTAILTRPTVGRPWLTTSPPIRRILCRYFHRSDESLGAAHFDATTFTKKWSEDATGSDQVAGQVESFWHEAAGLYLSQPAELEETLCASARNLAQSLRESPNYSINELRKLAADLLEDDEEFQDLIRPAADLWSRLREIIHPSEEGWDDRR